MMYTFITALLFGLISGVALGLTGGGSSVFGVPLLVYLVGLDVHLAIGYFAYSCWHICTGELTAPHKKGYVIYRVALLISLTGIPGVYAGSYLNKMVGGGMLILLFSILMIFIGINMLRTTHTENIEKHHTEPWRILLLGVSVGLLSGFW